MNFIAYFKINSLKMELSIQKIIKSYELSKFLHYKAKD